jgi:hypothetical protein
MGETADHSLVEFQVLLTIRNRQFAESNRSLDGPATNEGRDAKGQ